MLEGAAHNAQDSSMLKILMVIASVEIVLNPILFTGLLARYLSLKIRLIFLTLAQMSIGKTECVATIYLGMRNKYSYKVIFYIMFFC